MCSFSFLRRWRKRRRPPWLIGSSAASSSMKLAGLSLLLCRDMAGTFSTHHRRKRPQNGPGGEPHPLRRVSLGHPVYRVDKQNGHGAGAPVAVEGSKPKTVSRQAHSAATTGHHCCQGHGSFSQLSLARCASFLEDQDYSDIRWQSSMERKRLSTVNVMANGSGGARIASSSRPALPRKMMGR